MNDSDSHVAPKAFISYSWSSPEHEEWVLKFATELRESGVDAILDKWDLKEGHDPNAFMERMVTDPSVKKVILICDKGYKEKADSRKGGVGTEAQIISSEIYNQVQQEKFVAILVERDDNGKPFLPTYYASRIYLDLSNDELYAKNFDQLLRWVFDRPLFDKPGIGERPAFLSEPPEFSLGTSTRFRRALHDITNNRPSAEGNLREYFHTLTTNLEKFRLNDLSMGDYDDKIVGNIDQFIPYKSELIEIFAAIARYKNSQLNQLLHVFFEDLASYLPGHSDLYSRLNNVSVDNFKFIINELFLSAVAVLLKYENFAAANHLLTRRYRVPVAQFEKPIMDNFAIFNNPLPFLQYRKERLKIQTRSLHADLLKERTTGNEINFKDIMQADLVLFVRALMDSATDQESAEWYPETLIFMHRNHVFEVFLRSESRTYFDQLKAILGIGQKIQLQAVPQSGKKVLEGVLRHNLMTDVILDWMNFEKIESRF